jgi:hypothetical protein
MGKKDKQKAAPRARARRKTNNGQTMAVKSPIRPASDGSQVAIKPEVILIDDESDEESAISLAENIPTLGTSDVPMDECLSGRPGHF